MSANEENSIGKLQSVELTTELSKAYVDYAMSVIVARALPDVRDGLKPVHRRILYAMHQMGLSKGSTVKSAKIVGEVLGKLHPHGDQAVYDSLVRLAQNFNLRYPLIKGQGNFGSVDGDPAAAMRYTEAKLAKISDYMLADIEKDTVDFGDNFDATLKEPLFMPAILPNLLLMGSEGIAVGMATKIPPHNLGEIVDAVVKTIEKGKAVTKTQEVEKETDFVVKKIDLVASGEKKELDTEEIKPQNISFDSEITVEELVEVAPGPDFPTGGAIYGAEAMREIYATGRGKVKVRGIATIEESGRGKHQIIITEIPYQVNKARLVAKIADLVRNKKITGISDLRDESDKDGMRVVVEISQKARPKSVLNNLYKHTQLQTSFPSNFVALIDGVPQTLNLKTILIEFIRHRQQVIVRRTIFDLTSAKKRAHILEGLKIALDNLDSVIDTIKKSKTQEDAKTNLIKKFSLTEIQATAILDMQLRRLAALEREKIEKEYKEVMQEIASLISILKDPKKVLKIIEKELYELKEKHADSRRTKIYKKDLDSFTDEDLIPNKPILITTTRDGYIKSVPMGTFKSQRRGGKGVVGMTTKEEDEIEHIVSASTHDTILFFTNTGKVYGTRAWDIPETSRKSKGNAVVNIIDLAPEEEVRSILPLDSKESKHLIMTTQKGVVKKTALAKFENLRSSGLIAINLRKEDSVIAVHPTGGDDHIMLVTRNGKAIKFHEKDARPMGRDTTGVRGISLEKGDSVIAMEVFQSKLNKPKDKRKKVFRDLLAVSQNGLGKRTKIELFPLQKRGGKGVKVASLNDKTGTLSGALLVNQKTRQIIVTSKKGQVIKLPAKNIPQLGRATQGVILMRFTKKGDHVAAITALLGVEEEENGSTG